jgi:hypothetical protein
VGQIFDAMSLSQLILPAAENNDLREGEDLLATVLAYHWPPVEGNDESEVSEAEEVAPIAISTACDALKA